MKLASLMAKFGRFPVPRTREHRDGQQKSRVALLGGEEGIEGDRLDD